MKMMLITLLLLSAMASTASAAKFCPNSRVLSKPYGDVVKLLWDKYGEIADHLGTIGNGKNLHYLVQFTNKDKRSMSLILVDRAGESCMVSSANNWHHTTPSLPNTEEEEL